MSTNDKLSAIVRPVALWDLPAAQRAGILCEEVLVANVRRVGLLAEHLKRRGIHLETVAGGVALKRDGGVGWMTQLEYAHIDASIALTGLSPEDAAAAIAEGLITQGPEEEDARESQA